MSYELDDLARYLRENPVDHSKSTPFADLLPCKHRHARLDAASNKLVCPRCGEVDGAIP